MIAADRATPILALTTTIPAAPAAATNQASELTGPINAAAWFVSPIVSDRRTGNRFSNVTIEKPQNNSTATSESSTRDPRRRPMPSPITVGTARTDRPTAPSPRATRTSDISATIATTLTTPKTRATRRGTARASTPGSGSSATSPPATSAPTAIATLSTALPALRPFSICASGSAARVASTYQASSGPLSSARNTPCDTIAAANSPTESATYSSPTDNR